MGVHPVHAAEKDEEAEGKIYKMGFERSKGHFLIAYKTIFTVFPCLR